MKILRWFFCVVGLGVTFVGAEPAASEGGTRRAARPKIESRFRIGPFYESLRTDDGSTFRAIRPFYSSLQNEKDGVAIRDMLWPLGTHHKLRQDSWWRAGIAYGYDRDGNDAESSWSFNVFPLWFSGCDRVKGDYAALFPVYGYLPHTLFVLDEVRFALFPLYLNYEVNGARRNYWLWPLFSSSEELPGVKRYGFFPFYGRTERKGSRPGAVDRQHYFLWPLWNSTTYESGNNDGGSWMLWPLAGSVCRSNEQQRLFLPPFFSWSRTDEAYRLRCPWPLFEREKSPTADRLSIFPLYGNTKRGSTRKRYWLWPFFTDLNSDADGIETERFQFFPFYTEQSRVRKTDKGKKPMDSFLRVWPFFSKETRADGSSSLRALDLMPVRFAAGVDRNWAPFWTLFSRTERDGIASYDLLWGLIRFTTGAKKDSGVESGEAELPLLEEPLLSGLWEVK